MFKNLLRISLVFFAAIFAQNSFAEDRVSDSEVISEIEKSLIFDKDSREKIDFYKKQDSRISKKSDFTLNATAQDGTGEIVPAESQIKMVVTDPKSDNFDIREKEKFAYNAALVGQYEVAVEVLKQVLLVEPDNAYAKFSLAATYQKLGQFRQAKSLYYQLLKDRPANQEEIIGNLLAILIEESPRESVYLLARLSVENPNSANLLAQSATAYEKIKNYDQAISLLKRAVGMDPSNIVYEYNLAILYDKTERLEQALETYRNVEKKYSSNSNASISLLQVQKRIKSIQGKL